MLISLSIQYQLFDEQLFAGGTAGSLKIPTSAPSVPPSVQPIPTVPATAYYAETTRKTYAMYAQS